MYKQEIVSGGHFNGRYEDIVTVLVETDNHEPKFPTRHTPAPWEVCDDDLNVFAPETDTSITNVGHFTAPDSLEGEANARLIAAAPDLLEALRALCGQMLDRVAFDALPGDVEALDRAYTLIAKAEGR